MEVFDFGREIVILSLTPCRTFESTILGAFNQSQPPSLNFTKMVDAPIPVCDLLWTLEIKGIGHEAYVKWSKKIQE